MSFGADLQVIIQENANGLLSAHETWKRVPLSDVATIINGYPFDSTLFEKSGGAPLLRIRDIFNTTTDVNYSGSIPEGYWVLPGDIVIGMDGDFNCAQWKGIPALLNQRVCKITTNPEYIDQQFVFRALGGYLKAINDNTSSITVKHISSKTIADIPLPLPPFNEQKRIAEKLDSLLARVDSCQSHLERVSQIIKRFRQSVLAAATSGRLTEEWREKNNEENDWQKTTIGEVTTNGKQREPLPQDEFFYIDIASIDKNTKRITNPQKLTGENAPSRARQVVATGDVLVSMTRPNLNAVALVSGEYDGQIASTGFDVLRPVSIDSRWLYFLVRSDHFISEMSDLVQGALYPAIRPRDIRNFSIPLPPLAEQHEIIRRVETFFALSERIEARWRSAQERVGQLTTSLLAKAFRGELVEQDPNDEPAEKLLERIREAKVSAITKTKKPRWRLDMENMKTLEEGQRMSIVQALQKAGDELSSEQLFVAAGYPSDAESELVEEFFVDIRDALKDKQVKRKRHGDIDWFSLAS